MIVEIFSEPESQSHALTRLPCERNMKLLLAVGR
jgi:hypothetical protein